jgi:hypothetical protein
MTTMAAMATRKEPTDHAAAIQGRFTDEQRELQKAFTRSWEAAELHSTDPDARARIEVAMRKQPNWTSHDDFVAECRRRGIDLP